MILRRVIWIALGVAVLVGTVQTLLQSWVALPIIHAAEVFEGEKPASDVTASQAHAHDHSHEHDTAWTPASGLERLGWTWVANVNLSFSYALLVLVALSFWSRRRGTDMTTGRAALFVFAVGFMSFYLWPTVGLRPEIPGVEAPALSARQGWWLLAAVSALTAVATVLILTTKWRWMLAAALLVVPFLAGAPTLAGDPFSGFSSQAAGQLRDLRRQFVWATAWNALSQWLLISLGCAYAFNRWLQPLWAPPHGLCNSAAH